MRDTLGTGIYFMVYESGKQVVTTMAGDNPNSNKLAVVAAGGMCGLVSWAMICMSFLLSSISSQEIATDHDFFFFFEIPPADPIDSAKSIYQRNSLLHSRGETVEPAPKITFFKRQMYRGLGVSMGRSCVVNAIFFSSFELIKKRIKTMDDEANSANKPRTL